MRYDGILVRYGETFLKSERVRKLYVSRLRRSIRAATGEKARETRGLLVLPWKKGMEERLSKIPGIESFSPFIRLESLGDSRIDMLAEGKTRVNAKRSDKSFPMKSNEIARAVAMTMRERGVETVLSGQDTTITVHVTRSGIFAYNRTVPGLGGFPVGTNGRAVALVSGGIDSPVAAWMMIRKGVVVYPLFAMFPGDSAARFVRVCKVLSEYQPGERMEIFSFPIPFEACGKYAMIVYRRFMVRVAERLCKQLGCDFIITGDSLGQVSSQTAKNLSLVRSEYPILRPLIAMDKKEIIGLAKRIGTYDISISETGGCERVAKKIRASGAADPAEVERIERELGIGRIAGEVEISNITSLMDRLF